MKVCGIEYVMMIRADVNPIWKFHSIFDRLKRFYLIYIYEYPFYFKNSKVELLLRFFFLFVFVVDFFHSFNVIKMEPKEHLLDSIRCCILHIAL